MLKGKKSIYVLLPINLIIWGYIGFKIYSAMNEEEGFIPQEYTISKTKLMKEDSTHYTLSLNYKDPFLKQEYNSIDYSKKSLSNRNSTSTPTTLPNGNSVATEQKDIKFLGIIENKTSGVKTALISINGISHIIRKGETIVGFYVKSIDNENISLQQGKTVIKITKGKNTY